MSRRDELALRDYLEHIQQAIGRIQRYCGNQIKLETYCSPKPINQ